MSDYSYTPVYPVSADVTAVGLQLAQRQSDSGTNAGIADNGNPALGVLGQGGANDALGKGTAYLQAIADAVLCATGFQGEFGTSLGTNNTSSVTFADLPSSSITFSAPIAKTYIVHAHVTVFFTAGQVGFLRLVVNGNNGPTTIINDPVAASTTQYNVHLMASGACAAGNNTIKVQWAVGNAGSDTLNTNTNGATRYIISG